MRFFLTNLGDQKLILGYPWFAAMQPKVDWVRAWIDYDQLPVVLRTPDSHKATFTRRVGKTTAPKMNQDRWFIGRVMVEPHQIASTEKRQTLMSKLAQETRTTEITPYQRRTNSTRTCSANRRPKDSQAPEFGTMQSSSNQTPPHATRKGLRAHPGRAEGPAC